MKPYYIFAPEYRHTSSGNRAVYALHRMLIERGYQSYLSSGRKMPAPGEMIVVKPDIYDNDGSLGRIVRWVMYPMSGARVPRDDEMIFFYLKEFDYKNRGVGRLCVDTTELDLFNNDEQYHRVNECVFVGKGERVPRIPNTEGLISINLQYPISRKRLAALFKTSSVLYSYDKCTAIISEARLCGCPVCLIPEDTSYCLVPEIGIGRIGSMSKAEMTVDQFEAVFKEHVRGLAGDVDNFITNTQAEFK